MRHLSKKYKFILLIFKMLDLFTHKYHIQIKNHIIESLITIHDSITQI